LRALATRNAELQGRDNFTYFVSNLNGDASGSSVRVPISPFAREGDPQSSSNFPTVLRKDKQPIADIYELNGKRFANFFGNTIFFETIVEKKLGICVCETSRY
jgi:hypothetical protein